MASSSVLLALTLLAPAAQTGTPDASAAPLDVQQHLRIAMDFTKQAQEKRARFTCFKREHNQNFDGTGKLSNDTTKLFEETWINDLPYSRLVEVNGKPLEGKQLVDEQARFDKAVAERKALTTAERARLTGGRFYSSNISPEAVLTPAYRVTVMNAATCLGQPCHLYSADRVLATYDGKPVQPYTYRLWITDRNPMLTRVEFDATEDRGDVRRGSSGILEYELVDDVPVPAHTRFIGVIMVGSHRVRVDTDNTFSRYRRFSTAVSVRTADDNQPIPTDPQFK